MGWNTDIGGSKGYYGSESLHISHNWLYRTHHRSRRTNWVCGDYMPASTAVQTRELYESLQTVEIIVSRELQLHSWLQSLPIGSEKRVLIPATGRCKGSELESIIINRQILDGDDTVALQRMCHRPARQILL